MHNLLARTGRRCAAIGLIFLATSSVAQAVTSPPTIKERFTPLPCPAHSNTTIDYEGCLEHQLLVSDHQIDALTAIIFRRLRTAAAKSSFVNGELAWLRYRRASCSSQSSAVAGGSAHPLAYLRCQVNRNKTHMTDLAELRRSLRQ
jgi:uncharacterized protein YecT (DUF1311 family)